jgi:hypothetical protein
MNSEPKPEVFGIPYYNPVVKYERYAKDSIGKIGNLQTKSSKPTKKGYYLDYYIDQMK